MEAGYPNPPAAKSENLNPFIFPQHFSLKTLQLAQTLYELHQMGLIKEVIDNQGVPRFTPTGKSL